MFPLHPGSTLFPYTTLFRSWIGLGVLLARFGGTNRWLWLSFLAASLHQIEHIYLFTIYRIDPSFYTNGDRKSTRLNSSHTVISYAVFCLKKKNKKRHIANHT